MINEFVETWGRRKYEIESSFRTKHPESYVDIVREVVRILKRDNNIWGSPDPERIHTIDEGQYQGTLVFIIAAGGYQPSRYWGVTVDYGSCSGCDTLERIQSETSWYDRDKAPTESQVKDYMTLALHIVQGLKEI